MVSSEGYTLDMDSINPVLNLQNTTPKTVGDIRKLIGLLGYYRRYIKDFSRIAKPIYDFLTAPIESKSRIRNEKLNFKIKHLSNQLPSNFNIRWTEEHQKALDQVVKLLTSPPIMAYPCFKDPFILHMDASEVGLGAVLYQKQNGILKGIAYGSRTLCPAEKNYHLHSGKLDFLALKWAICEQRRDYLYYAPSFVVYTDNNPLTYVLSSAKLNASGLRWINDLADCNFSIKYLPGSSHQDADTLLHLPLDFESYMDSCTEKFSIAEHQAVMNATNFIDTGQSNWVSSSTTNKTAFDFADLPKGTTSTKVTFNDLCQSQITDHAISRVRFLVSKGKKPDSKEISSELPDVKRLLYEWNKLDISDKDLLVRSNRRTKQIVLPK